MKDDPEDAVQFTGEAEHRCSDGTRGSEGNRLANACQTHDEKLVVWTLLDTGLRVAELASLAKAHLDWQGHRLTVYGRE